MVFHLAGAVGASPDLELVLPTFHSLLTSTSTCWWPRREVGCRRIVFSGSLTEPVTGSGTTPQSPYAAAKWAASCYGRMFHSLYDAPVVILRPSMSYGPGQAAAKLVPSVTLSLLRGERPMLASGKARLDWVYISDVIDGFVAARPRQELKARRSISARERWFPPPTSPAAWSASSARTSSLNSAPCPTDRRNLRFPRTLWSPPGGWDGERQPHWTTGFDKRWTGTGR